MPSVTIQYLYVCLDKTYSAMPDNSHKCSDKLLSNFCPILTKVKYFLAQYLDEVQLMFATRMLEFELKYTLFDFAYICGMGECRSIPHLIHRLTRPTVY